MTNSSSVVVEAVAAACGSRSRSDAAKTVQRVLVTHRLPDLGRFRGACAITAVMSCLFMGPLLPVATVGAFCGGYTVSAACLLGGIISSWVLAGHSTAWCRFFLGAAGFFPLGVFLHVEEEAIKEMSRNQCIWCMHPHGTSIGFGFTMNGAIRFRAEDEQRYVPEELRNSMSQDRMRTADGVQAPVLFRMPILRNALLGFGCCKPATKEEMTRLMRSGVDFGILPGGMEEVALYDKGRERVYIRKRAGFVKYALQHGYTLQPSYTFGECDQYSSLRHPLYRRFCLFTLSNFGFVVPVFWGPRWWAPLLPSAHVPIHTVVAEAIPLPKIENPTNDDVAKYHAMYIQSLQNIFDRYKARFGYADRELEIL